MKSSKIPIELFQRAEEGILRIFAHRISQPVNQTLQDKFEGNDKTTNKVWIEPEIHEEMVLQFLHIQQRSRKHCRLHRR